MAGTQQRGAQCNGKLCLRVWIFNQKALKCAGAWKDGTRSVLHYYFDHSIEEQIGDCNMVVVEMKISRWILEDIYETV